jgi:2-oxoglutarate dehydrogenase E2 component (dihydrolipoamide succinyltransferase)
MPTQIVMPQLGESVVEGTVSRWLKQVGDPVQAFEPLLEVSTDKVDTEIPSPAAGVLLSIVVEAGSTVAHGTLLGVIGAPGEQPVAAAPAAPPSAPVSAPAAPPASASTPENGYSGHVTPVVARMAAEHQLDLNRITGTGRDGRITKRDVERFLEAQGAGKPAAVDPWDQPGSGDLFKPTVEYGETAPPPAPPAPAPRPVAPVSAAPAPAPRPSSTSGDGTLTPLTAMRRAIAEHMVRSRHTSPHVTTVFEVDLTAVTAHRAGHKADFHAAGVPLTLTAYFMVAAAAALRAVPMLNAEWREEGIFQHRAQHIGMAVALQDGLIVPVVRNAGDLNLLGMARAVHDLAHRARDKALKPDEVTGGTFTITNHGVSGSIVAMPIINQPQVGILGVGAMEKRVKVITDAAGHDMIAIRPCAYLSLTFDHRVVDGAGADAFMSEVKRLLEGWDGR